MKNIICSLLLISVLSSVGQAAPLSENKANTLALELSYAYQISATEPVAIFLGATNVLAFEKISPRVTRETVAFDFILYPSDDDSLQLVGPASAYLGCQAVIEFTQLETPSKIPDFDGKIISQTCEQSLIRKNPVSPTTP